MKVVKLEDLSGFFPTRIKINNITPKMKTAVVERDFIQQGLLLLPRLDQFEEVMLLNLAKAVGLYSWGILP